MRFDVVSSLGFRAHTLAVRKKCWFSPALVLHMLSYRAFVIMVALSYHFNAGLSIHFDEKIYQHKVDGLGKMP